jgi:hypothetical protein
MGKTKTESFALQAKRDFIQQTVSCDDVKTWTDALQAAITAMQEQVADAELAVLRHERFNRADAVEAAESRLAKHQRNLRLILTLEKFLRAGKIKPMDMARALIEVSDVYTPKE